MINKLINFDMFGYSFGFLFGIGYDIESAAYSLRSYSGFSDQIVWVSDSVTKALMAEDYACLPFVTYSVQQSAVACCMFTWHYVVCLRFYFT